MSSRLISVKHLINPGTIGVTSTAATGNQVLIGPIDVGHYDTFSFLFQNSSTATAFVDLKVQAAVDPTVSASDTADNWVQIPTATLPQPSALGTLSSVLTGPVTNVYKFIRVVGCVTTSTTQNILSVTICGHKAE